MERGRRACRTVGVEAPIHLAVDGGQRREDRLVEEGEHRPHLVQRLRSVAADRVGAPQPGDLLAHPPVDLVLLGAPELRALLELVQQIPDAPEVLDDGAALRLGGVRGEDGRDPERRRHAAQRPRERGDRVLQRRA